MGLSAVWEKRPGFLLIENEGRVVVCVVFFEDACPHNPFPPPPFPPLMRPPLRATTPRRGLAPRASDGGGGGDRDGGGPSAPPPRVQRRRRKPRKDADGPLSLDSFNPYAMGRKSR